MPAVLHFKRCVWVGLLLIGVSGAGTPAVSQAQSPVLRLQPVPQGAKFTDPGYFVWCGSMTKGDNGRYYLFYSRWPLTKGFDGWVTDSEVALAVADNATGPYKPLKVVLPARTGDFWDRDVTHNPTVHKFGGRYYLYYMGNHGNGEFWDHRNHQRIGVAVADTPDGPWQRAGQPLIDVTPGSYDHLMTSNPAVCRRPDGTFLMVYKGVGEGKLPFGGTVSHGVAIANGPTGPFTKQPTPIFQKKGVKFPAEDPFIWVQGERLYALVKDMKGVFTNAGTSLALFESPDGLTWQPAPNALVSRLEINWEQRGRQPVQRLERPQLYVEKGKPMVLFCAVKESDSVTYNVAIPLTLN